MRTGVFTCFINYLPKIKEMLSHQQLIKHNINKKVKDNCRLTSSIVRNEN